jgi:hypothetical protein
MIKNEPSLSHSPQCRLSEWEFFFLVKILINVSKNGYLWKKSLKFNKFQIGQK